MVTAKPKRAHWIMTPEDQKLMRQLKAQVKLEHGPQTNSGIVRMALRQMLAK